MELVEAKTAPASTYLLIRRLSLSATPFGGGGCCGSITLGNEAPPLPPSTTAMAVALAAGESRSGRKIRRASSGDCIAGK